MCKLFYIKQKFGHGADDDHSMLVYDDCMMMMMITKAKKEEDGQYVCINGGLLANSKL